MITHFFMTEKQENILKAALELFANEGVNSVSTNMIAKKAGVSEGLIFRHFTNKEGLLNAILEKGNEKANKYFGSIVFESNPKEILRKFIELPAAINPNEYTYWRLIYSLKWQKGGYDAGKLEPLKVALVNAFQKLGYDFPDAEADLLLQYFDGMATHLLLHNSTNIKATVNLLKSKYKV